MKCYQCGQEIDDYAQNCPYCGEFLGAGATTVLDQTMNPYVAGTGTKTLNADYVYGNTSGGQRPAIQFPTNRGLLKMIFLSIVTLGIYGVVIISKIITELNIAASRYDGKRTMPYFAMVTLTPFTLGIYALVWQHKLANRIGVELTRRGCQYSFGASDFWLWGVLGSLILIGLLVYMHKLLKSMNLINESFNQYG